jgi:hypothetical protein
MCHLPAGGWHISFNSTHNDLTLYEREMEVITEINKI